MHVGVRAPVTYDEPVEPVWKSSSESGAPDISSRTRFAATTWPHRLDRAVRDPRHRTPSRRRRGDGVEVDSMIQREGTNFDCYTGWNRRVPAPGSAPPDGDLCGRARREVEVELPHMIKRVVRPTARGARVRLQHSRERWSRSHTSFRSSRNDSSGPLDEGGPRRAASATVAGHVEARTARGAKYHKSAALATVICHFLVSRSLSRLTLHTQGSFYSPCRRMSAFSSDKKLPRADRRSEPPEGRPRGKSG